MHLPLTVVLAGGFGTRLRHVLSGAPKPLAPVAGRPFLEWLLRYLRKQGVCRVVLSTGYRADAVQMFATSLSLPGLDVSCVSETEPLGTAGGFLNALEGERVSALVCNGDSLVLTRLDPLAEAAADADGALLGVQVQDAARFGSLRTRDGLLAGFDEKRSGSGLINAGMYLFSAPSLARFPRKRPLSFEYDVFPALLAAGARLAVVSCEAPFIDIGTEESLGRATAFIRENGSWFE